MVRHVPWNGVGVEIAVALLLAAPIIILQWSVLHPTRLLRHLCHNLIELVRMMRMEVHRRIG